MDFFNLMSEFGFPAIVCMYLLIRIETKLQYLSDSINSLSLTIKEIKF